MDTAYVREVAEPRCTSNRLHEVDYEDADPVRLTQSFLQARERFLHELLSG